MNPHFKYHAAISFAEEDRNAALALSLAFELKGIGNIYYYPEQPAATNGKVLIDELKEIYGSKARYTIILASEKYFQKTLAQCELDAIYNRVQQQPDIHCVILVKLNEALDLSHHDFLGKLGYVLWEFNPKRVADILIAYMGTQKPDEMKAANPKSEIFNLSQIINSNEAINSQNIAIINYKYGGRNK